MASNRGASPLVRVRCTLKESWDTYDALPPVIREAIMYTGHNLSPVAVQDYMRKHSIRATLDKIISTSRIVHYHAFPEQAPSIDL